MSDSFFQSLSIPKPYIDLEIGSGSHAEQVGKTMIAFEKVLHQKRPDWVVLVGDINATCACSITAKKEHIQVAHIEAGLRSFDLDMPEEINRMVTDRLSDLLFTTDSIADANLLKEGVPANRIKQVGNIMIDSLEAQRLTASALNLNSLCDSFAIPGASQPVPPLRDNRYCVITLHRPSNVDDLDVLAPLVNILTADIAPVIPLIWPVHPRTRKKLEAAGLWDQLLKTPGLVLTQPLGYHEMLRLTMGAKVMLTDSGGLQEECCILGTPCLTLRDNTERPLTLREHGGVSILVGNDTDRIRAEFRATATLPRTIHRPPLWDGHTAERIVACFR
jgi:UDP-N-acetylglucosamine 2-epimerase (non-hydrolysing)